MMPAVPAPQTGGLYVRTTLTCEEAVRRTHAALSDAGFRYLTEIDVNASLKASLQQFMGHYRILGADVAPEPLHQVSGHVALSSDAPQALPLTDCEMDWGLALPCNVDVFVDPHTGETVVMAADPDTLIMEYGQRTVVSEHNETIRAKLEAALSQLTVVE